MRTVLSLLGWVAALATTAPLHLLAGAVTLIGTCGVSDTGGSVPARASWQGRVCATRADDWWQVPLVWVLVVSAVAAATVAVLLASRPGHVVRRVVAAGAVVLLAPVVTGLALRLPPDACTDAQRSEAGPGACGTRSEA